MSGLEVNELYHRIGNDYCAYKDTDAGASTRLDMALIIDVKGWYGLRKQVKSPEDSVHRPAVL